MARFEVRVPDIGDFHDIPVIEVLVKPGDTVGRDAALVTLESDKATMEVPSPAAGVVQALTVKIGDKVSEGSPLLTLEAEAAPADTPHAAAPAGTPNAAPPTRDVAPDGEPEKPVPVPAPADSPPAGGEESAQPPTARPSAGLNGPEGHPIARPARIDDAAFRKAHASPAVRKYARELGVDLAQIRGSGPKDRILVDDVQAFVKQVLAGAVTAGGSAAAGIAPALHGIALLPWPTIDFAKFGPIDVEPLSRIRKISGANLHRNWVSIPHVTQHDDADVTGLEAFRIAAGKENEKSGIKVTMLAFLIKAVVGTLRKYPEFNASLDGDSLVLKRYFHIGFAADTPHGLVVPVIRDADRKGVFAIAAEMATLSARAREGKLGPADMQGGTFSISSLGGIGGTYFTPIINAPEVAILGVSRARTVPVWSGAVFEPRLMLPLSLSYDHRVIDGAAAARFTTHLVTLLADLRRAVL